MAGTDVGLADLSCLNTPSADQATTVAVSLATVVLDYQQHTFVPNAKVTAFKDIDYTHPFDTQTSSATSCPTAAPCGDVTITIPVGTKRFGFQMTDTAMPATFLPTFLLFQYVDPGMASQTLERVQTISESTATLLPALIDVTRTPGSGVLAGALRDCQHHEISNFVAAVSSTQGTATPIGAAYYFQAGVDLPVHHCKNGVCGNSQADAASSDGLFLVLNLPAAPTAYVQMWGYPTDADVGGDMTLVAELALPVLTDTVITGSYEPLRQ
jgi:hypothetical protein